MYEESKFKTLRHIETVRNHLDFVIIKLLERAEQHDQSKLQEPEAAGYDQVTDKLRGMTYGSAEYKESLKALEPVLQHHYANNKHHPEHWPNGIKDMSLIDVIEMLCDWKSSTMRHDGGNILKSIELNQPRFGYSNDVAQLLINTAKLFEEAGVEHHAKES